MMTVNRYLDQVKIIKGKINQKQNELSLEDEMAKSLSSPQIGGISSATKNTTPSYVRHIEKKEEIQAEIDRLNEELDLATANIEALIDTLDDVRCKSVLIYRHIFGLKWKDIGNKLGYTDRWVVELHKLAVAELKEKNSSHFTLTSS